VPRVFATALAALVTLAIAAAPGLAQEPRASLPDIEDEVMCPICGVPLELAIDAPQAQRQREFIRELIAEGRTKEEIKDALVVEFGDEVLAVPETSGFDLAAWLVPGAAILVAAVAILLALRRWRGEDRRAAGERTAGERAAGERTAGGDSRPGSPGASATGPQARTWEEAEEERALEADLARYEL
jgi:cytochrome c-type biogenesis protein CcmH